MPFPADDIELVARGWLMNQGLDDGTFDGLLRAGVVDRDVLVGLAARRLHARTAVHGASPTNGRRTRAQVEVVVDVLLDDRPMTVRQVFYRLVSGGVLPKTEAAYKGLGRLLTQISRSDSSAPLRTLFGHYATRSPGAGCPRAPSGAVG